jgi:hypothetical protein
MCLSGLLYHLGKDLQVDLSWIHCSLCTIIYDSLNFFTYIDVVLPKCIYKYNIYWIDVRLALIHLDIIIWSRETLHNGFWTTSVWIGGQGLDWLVCSEWWSSLRELLPQHWTTASQSASHTAGHLESKFPLHLDSIHFLTILG